METIQVSGIPALSQTELKHLADALELVVFERGRQSLKWGEQNHSAEVWVSILGEEFGELCKCVLQHRFPHLDDPNAPGHVRMDIETINALRVETVQVAAVAVAMIEYLSRVAADELDDD